MGAVGKTVRRVSLLVVAASVALGTGVAAAAPGHASCRALGETTAAEARDHVLVPEILAFAPGGVDDLIELVQVGGTFGGEVVEPLCTPK